MDGSSDVGPYYSRCIFPLLYGWSVAIFCIYVHIVCNTKWSRYFSIVVYITGNKYHYVVLSALFSSFAVFCRQTNIILSVLNPALILLLRVCFFISDSYFSSMDWFGRVRNLRSLEHKSFIYSHWFSPNSNSFFVSQFHTSLYSFHSYYSSWRTDFRWYWAIANIIPCHSI